jgi:hypothetical protein
LELPLKLAADLAAPVVLKLAKPADAAIVFHVCLELETVLPAMVNKFRQRRPNLRRKLRS